jgi:hypothetical protein
MLDLLSVSYTPVVLKPRPLQYVFGNHNYKINFGIQNYLCIPNTNMFVNHKQNKSLGIIAPFSECCLNPGVAYPFPAHMAQNILAKKMRFSRRHLIPRFFLLPIFAEARSPDAPTRAHLLHKHSGGHIFVHDVVR